jgi:hypothetical protein
MAHIAHQPGPVCVEGGVSRWLAGAWWLWGGGAQNIIGHAGSSGRRHEPPRRELRSRLQHRYLPRTRSSAAHARAVAPGMFPDVGRDLFGEGVFDTRGHRYTLLLQGRSTLGTERNTAWARSARGQLNAALHVSASAPSAQLAAARVASGHGSRSKRRCEKPGVGSTRRRRRSSCAHGAERQPGCCQRPGPEARSASSNSTPRPWTRHSASGP